jgi:hypothetical protein
MEGHEVKRYIEVPPDVIKVAVRKELILRGEIKAEQVIDADHFNLCNIHFLVLDPGEKA